MAEGLSLHERALVEVGEAALRQQRPSVLYKPSLVFEDGAWHAILGDDPQRHFTASGPTPAAAMENFDNLFYLAVAPAGGGEEPADTSPIELTPAAIIAAVKAPIPTPPRGAPMLGPAALIDYTQEVIAKRLEELLAR